MWNICCNDGTFGWFCILRLQIPIDLKFNFNHIIHTNILLVAKMKGKYCTIYEGKSLEPYNGIPKNFLYNQYIFLYNQYTLLYNQYTLLSAKMKNCRWSYVKKNLNKFNKIWWIEQILPTNACVYINQNLNFDNYCL